MKIIKPYLCTLVAAIVCAITAHAADVALKLSLTDGTAHVYVLGEKPVMTFDADDTVTFATSTASTSYRRSDVAEIMFVDAAGAPETIVDYDNVLKVSDRMAEAPGRLINVYSTDGREVASGYQHVDLKALTTGIYIVKAGNQSLKIKL